MKLTGPERVIRAYPILSTHIADHAEAKKLAGMKKDVNFYNNASCHEEQSNCIKCCI